MWMVLRADSAAPKNVDFQFLPAVDPFVSVDFSIRYLDMPGKHAISPEVMLVEKTIRLADHGGNGCASDQTDSRNGH